MVKSKIQVRYFVKKGAGNTPQVQQKSLDEVVIRLLSGVEHITPAAFVRIAQRTILTLRNFHILTQIAVAAGQPGMELKDPEAVKLPDDISASEAHAIRSMTRRVAKMLAEIRKDMEQVVRALPKKCGDILISEPTDQINLGELYQVVLDEAAALITAGSASEISADFGLVLRGLSILIENTNSTEALNLPLNLIKMLPSRQDEIIASLLPYCSVAQRKALLNLERVSV